MSRYSFGLRHNHAPRHHDPVRRKSSRPARAAAVGTSRAPSTGAPLDTDGQFVTMEGCFNFRDIGGYRATTGRLVRRGTIYRADALHRLTATGRAGLTQLGIATILDLRTADEVAAGPWQPPPQWPGRWRHLPLREATPDWSGLTADQAADPELAIAHYTETLRRGGPALVAVFSALCQPGALPAVFHCAAGKDRTGIVAALLLRLLGVDSQIVTADYALSDLATARWEASVAAGTPDDTQTAWAYVPPAMLTADKAIMSGFLDRIDAEYGSVDTLLLGHGLAPAAITRLRHALLTDDPERQLKNPVRA